MSPETYEALRVAFVVGLLGAALAFLVGRSMTAALLLSGVLAVVIAFTVVFVAVFLLLATFS